MLPAEVSGDPELLILRILNFAENTAFLPDTGGMGYFENMVLGG